MRHCCILIGEQLRADWRFGDGEDPRGSCFFGLITNDGSVSHAWALQGAGIALKSIWDVGNDTPSMPTERHLAPRMRLFVEFVRERLKKEWRW